MHKAKQRFLCVMGVLATSIVVILLESCSTTPEKMYSGEDLPASKTAIVQSADASINITKCDGIKTTSASIVVLPGDHTLDIYFRTLGSEGYYGNFSIKFTAEASHVYAVGVEIGRGAYAFIKDKTIGKRIAFTQGKQRYDQARIALAEKGIKQDPNNANHWAKKGDALVRLERYEEALPVLDKAISLNPKLVVAWVSKGWALCELKRYDDALNAINNAIRIQPNSQILLKGRKLITDAMEGRYVSREEMETLTPGD